METKHILEILAKLNAKMGPNQAEIKADRKAYQEEMMDILYAHYERTMACVVRTEADTEKTEPDPGMM
jgi:hypothetical protein